MKKKKKHDNRFNEIFNAYKIHYTVLSEYYQCIDRLKKSSDERIGDLENWVKQIEKANCQESQTSVSAMKEDLMKSLKEDVETLVDSRTKKFDDRKKETSLFYYFNLPEHRLQSSEENKKRMIMRIMLCV